MPGVAGFFERILCLAEKVKPTAVLASSMAAAVSQELIF
jgi:hypothetical protein